MFRRVLVILLLMLLMFLFLSCKSISHGEKQVSVSDRYVYYLENDYLSGSDLDLLARIISAESKGEPKEAKYCVGITILNRVLSPKFPNSIKGVIYQANQFTPVSNGTFKLVPTEESFSVAYKLLTDLSYLKTNLIAFESVPNDYVHSDWAKFEFKVGNMKFYSLR